MAQTKVTDNKQSVPFEEALSLAGYGIFNALVLLATGGGLMCVIIETMCMMFIIPAAQCDLDLTLSEKGLLSSIGFFGMVFSSHMWGYIADTRGRRLAIIYSLTFSSITTFICSIVPWVELLIALRFINGFLISGTSSVVYAYLGEFHDNKFRPKVISWMTTFVAFGSMFLPGLAWIILPQEWSLDIPFLPKGFRPWRLLLIIYGLPGLIFAFSMYCLPESPKYLINQGESVQALEVIKKIHRMNIGDKGVAFHVKELIWDEGMDGNAKRRKGILRSVWEQTVPLFTGDLLKKTLMISFIQFAIFASNSGIMMWYPQILNWMSHYAINEPNQEVTICKAVMHEKNSTLVDSDCNDVVKPEVFLISLIMGCAYTITYIFNGFVINLLGKKPLLIMFITFSLVPGFVSQFVSGYTLIQILIGVFLLGGVTIGVANAIAVDLFPTQVRAMALAISLMCGRLGAITGTNTVGPVLYNYCDYLFYFIAADQLALLIVVILLPSARQPPKLEATP